jgi:hypothetical protein
MGFNYTGNASGGSVRKRFKACIRQCRRLKLVRLYERTHTLIRQHFQQ